MTSVPVLEIGGTHVTAAVVHTQDWSATQLRRHGVTPHGTCTEILTAFVTAGAELDAENDATWGVAMPDPFDYDAGVARFRDVGKFDALDGVDVGAALRAGLPQHPARVVFHNDADAFVLGEWCAGAATGRRRCVGITLGTGLGTGWIVDGRITTTEPGVPPLGRARTLNLGGIGLEEIVSTRGILRRFTAAGGSVDVSVRDIATLARGGDRRAGTVLDGVSTDLGRGLGPALRAFAPDIVVIGGSMARAWDLLAPSFDRGLAWPARPPVVVSASTELAALRGAAYAARDTTVTPR